MGHPWTQEEVRAQPGKFWKPLIQEEPYSSWDAAKVWEVVRERMDDSRLSTQPSPHGHRA